MQEHREKYKKYVVQSLKEQFSELKKYRDEQVRGFETPATHAHRCVSFSLVLFVVLFPTIDYPSLLYVLRYRTKLCWKRNAGA